MTARLDEKLELIYEDVLHRNPGENEYHQAVHEVLETLGPVLVKYPEFAEKKSFSGSASPNAKLFSGCPGRMIAVRSISTVPSAWNSTAL